LQSTMLYVTHDQAEAMTMGDRIVVMKDGVIQQADDPMTLYDNPRNMFVAGFIGSPAMNFFRGSIQQLENGLCFVESLSGGENGFVIALTDTLAAALTSYCTRSVVFGIRPEDLAIPEDPALRSACATVEVVE